MKTSSISIDKLMKEEIERYNKSLNPKAKYTRCFNCSEPFPTKPGKYYCNKKCGREKHYIKFKIRKGKV